MKMLLDPVFFTPTEGSFSAPVTGIKPATSLAEPPKPTAPLTTDLAGATALAMENKAVLLRSGNRKIDKQLRYLSDISKDVESSTKIPFADKRLITETINSALTNPTRTAFLTTLIKIIIQQLNPYAGGDGTLQTRLRELKKLI